MRRSALTVLTLALTGLPAAGWSQSVEEDAAANLFSVRVIYLREASNDAMTLVRSRAHVRRAATLLDRNVIVVADVADTVDRCEALLREHHAVVRVADPHAPLELGRYEPRPSSTR